MFRRKRSNEGEQYDQEPGPEDQVVPPAETAVEETPSDGAEPVPAAGPWDVADAPADDIARLDLGALQIPSIDGVEVRLDVDQGSQQIVSVTLAAGTGVSLMQLMAFAAPKSSGIWDEVRAEIVASIRSGGGRAEVVQGAYGPEVVADVPTDVAGQLAPARFYGVDGPRWFLRALVQGRAATTPSADPALLRSFREVVVVRGEEAMAVRDPLPLQMPKEALELAEQLQAQAAEAQRSKPDISLLERGPEITETR